jgi:DNA-directed RNA polymerase subunit P
MGEEKSGSGPIYECVRCGNRVYLSELEKYVSFRCPECGYRIFKKVRPAIVKRVKAR